MSEAASNEATDAAVTSVRQPQHHGVFYPAEPLILKRQLDDCLRQAEACLAGDSRAISGRIKALVVPHAGYDYSAPVAARAYAALYGEDWIRRIVILAPNHQTAKAGGLFGSYDTWLTPLGTVAIDQPFIHQHWAKLIHVGVDNAVHQSEYSIEVQLPFLQRVLADVPVAPMLLGECTSQQITDILRPAWDCHETLIIISSDLYHYLPRESALSTGRAIVCALEQNDSAFITPQTACGYIALRGLMRLAETRSCYWRALAVGHSGQSRHVSVDSLVGYGAFSLSTVPVCRITD